MGGIHEEVLTSNAGQMEEAESADDGGTCRNIWKAMAWAAYDGEVPVVIIRRSILGWRSTALWRNKKCMEHESRPHERLKMEAQMVISQQGFDVGG